jgi:hypothetical protein
MRLIALLVIRSSVKLAASVVDNINSWVNQLAPLIKIRRLNERRSPNIYAKAPEPTQGDQRNV